MSRCERQRERKWGIGLSVEEKMIEINKTQIKGMVKADNLLSLLK